MAAQQRTEKEDSDFKVSPPPPDSSPLRICSNDDCGLAVSTNNMCQKCFNLSSSSSSSSDHHHQHHNPNPQPRSSPSPPPPPPRPQRRKPVPTTSPPLFRREVNRCSGCSRKVGLTGFRCRCGDLFCAEHRYSDRHDCSYDYKAAGREAISRENPVIKAAKIVRV